MEPDQTDQVGPKEAVKLTRRKLDDLEPLRAAWADDRAGAVTRADLLLTLTTLQRLREADDKRY